MIMLKVVVCCAYVISTTRQCIFVSNAFSEVSNIRKLYFFLTQSRCNPSKTVAGEALDFNSGSISSVYTRLIRESFDFCRHTKIKKTHLIVILLVVKTLYCSLN